MAAGTIADILGSLRKSAGASLAGASGGNRAFSAGGAAVLPAMDAFFADVAKIEEFGADLARRLCVEAAQAAIARLRSVQGDPRYYGVGALIQALEAPPFVLAEEPAAGIWRYGAGRIKEDQGVGSAPEHPIAEFLAYWRDKMGHALGGKRFHHQARAPRTVKPPKPPRALSARELAMGREARNRLALHASSARMAALAHGPWDPGYKRAALRSERHLRLILTTPLSASDLGALGRSVEAARQANARVARAAYRSLPKQRAAARLAVNKPQRMASRMGRPFWRTARQRAGRPGPLLGRILLAEGVTTHPSESTRPVRRGGAASAPTRAAALAKRNQRLGGRRGLVATIHRLSLNQQAALIAAIPAKEPYQAGRVYRQRLSERGLHDKRTKAVVRLAARLPTYTAGGPHRGRSALVRVSRVETRQRAIGGLLGRQIVARKAVALNRLPLVARDSKGRALLRMQRRPVSVVPRGGPYGGRHEGSRARLGVTVEARSIARLSAGLTKRPIPQRLATREQAAYALFRPLATLHKLNPALAARANQALSRALPAQQDAVIRGLYAQYKLPAEAPGRQADLSAHLRRPEAQAISRALSVIRPYLREHQQGGKQ